MPSPSTSRAQCALWSGLASFTFFTLAWHFAGGYGLAVSLGLAAFMGAIIAIANWSLSRSRNSSARR